MPPDEGLALHEAALGVPSGGSPMLEIGSYCGKSAIYLGAAAHERGTVLFALDHHRGSEENQPGWEWHEPDLVDPEVGRIDTLPRFRRTVFDAGLEGDVVALVGDSPTVGRHWQIPLAFLFIDGGHGAEPAHRDYELWTPWVEPGGPAGHPRRVPRPGRRRSPAVRDLLPGAGVGRLHRRLAPPARCGSCAAPPDRPHAALGRRDAAPPTRRRERRGPAVSRWGRRRARRRARPAPAGRRGR